MVEIVRLNTQNAHLRVRLAQGSGKGAAGEEDESSEREAKEEMDVWGLPTSLMSPRGSLIRDSLGPEGMAPHHRKSGAESETWESLPGLEFSLRKEWLADTKFS